MARPRATTRLILGLLLCLCWGMAGSQVFDINKLVDTAKKTKDLGDKDEADELELGEQMAATLLGAAPLSPVETEQAYVSRVGHWIAQHSDRPHLPWRFGVLDDDTINAFAAPAGHVLITRGLLLQLNSEAELAGVLAHEIAHVTLEHHLKAIKKAAGMEVAGSVIGLARGFRSEGGTERIVTDKVLGATRELYARGLDRGDEFEADLWALTYMSRAGYDPYAYAAVLQWLDTIAESDSQVALLFTTHPKPADRLERVGEQLMGPYAGLSGADLGERFRTRLGGLALAGEASGDPVEEPAGEPARD